MSSSAGGGVVVVAEEDGDDDDMSAKLETLRGNKQQCFPVRYSDDLAQERGNARPVLANNNQSMQTTT